MSEKSILTLGVLFSLCFVALLWFLNQGKSNTVPNVNDNVVSISPTPSTIDTVNWKTYTDKTWKYSVMYPATWKVYSYGKPVIYLLPPDSVEPGDGSVSVSLVLNVAEPRIPSNWIDYKLIDSKIFDGATWAAKNNQNNQIYFWKNTIEVDGQIIKSPVITQEIFETILSTFKFTESKDNLVILQNKLNQSDWKSYKNSRYGYQLKYPSTWSVSEQANEIIINNSIKTVALRISLDQIEYGFEGEVIKKGPIQFVVDGQTVSASENIVENRTVFVDHTIDIGDNKFFILFGTGYPVNEDKRASLTDYRAEKDSLIQILSTFKFTE